MRICEDQHAHREKPGFIHVCLTLSNIYTHPPTPSFFSSFFQYYITSKLLLPALLTQVFALRFIHKRSTENKRTFPITNNALARVCTTHRNVFGSCVFVPLAGCCDSWERNERRLSTSGNPVASNFTIVRVDTKHSDRQVSSSLTF